MRPIRAHFFFRSLAFAAEILTAIDQFRSALVAGLLLSSGVVMADAAESTPRFRLEVESDGVYTVTFEDLATAGLVEIAPSTGFALASGGQAIPVWVDDGGDDQFGPGDAVWFVGRSLRLDGASLSPWAVNNVYTLSLDAAESLHMERREAAPGLVCADAPGFRRNVRLQEDRRRISLSRPRETLFEWVWRQISVLDRESVVIDLPIYDLAAETGGAVEITLGLVGVSRLQRGGRSTLKDHTLEVGLGERTLTTVEWDNDGASHTVDLPTVDSAELAAAGGRLWLRTPRRELEDGNPVVDAAALDWLEMSYLRTRVVGDGGGVLEWQGGAAVGCLGFLSPSPEPLVTFSADGVVALTTVSTLPQGELFEHTVAGMAEEGTLWVVGCGGGARPALIELDEPSDLRNSTNRADYIMISHRSLVAAIEPLADLHRARGLEVVVVDVQDVYDEFNHGIAHPSAIRDFLGFARENWSAPAPRFVLLVGDACWDIRGVHEGDAAGAARKALMPTWWIYNGGLANASDSLFVAPSFTDGGATVAVGRLPASTPGEVASVVAKVRRRLQKTDVGPWRRRALLIGDGLQPDLTTTLRRQFASAGFESDVIEPSGDRVAGAGHRGRLRDNIGGGHQLIHFAGHGSSIAWRTARADHARGSDLFARDDIPLLTPRDGLPIVLAMTCASAPFDSPRIDSIGERLLETPDRGAAAVIAYSGLTARVNRNMSGILIQELLVPSATVGEALFRAKRRIERWDFTYTLNLLGDPALPLDLDDPGLEVEALDSPPFTVSVAGSGASGGTAEVTWFGDDGETLDWVRRPVSGSSEIVVEPGCDLAADEVAAVGVYVWDESARWDGLAALTLKEPPKRKESMSRRPARRVPPGRGRSLGEGGFRGGGRSRPPQSEGDGEGRPDAVSTPVPPRH